MQDQTQNSNGTSPEEVVSEALSILINGVADRYREAAEAVTEPWRGRVLTYGNTSSRLVLRSFEDFAAIISLLERLVEE